MNVLLTKYMTIISDVGNRSEATRKSIKGAFYSLKTSGISPISYNTNPEYCLYVSKAESKMETPTNCFGILHVEGPPSAAGSARALSTLRMKINFGPVPGPDIIISTAGTRVKTVQLSVDIQSPNATC